MKHQRNQTWICALAMAAAVAASGCNNSFIPTGITKDGSGGPGENSSGEGGLEGEEGSSPMCEPGYDWAGILEIGAKQEACKKGSLWMKLSQHDGNRLWISLHTDPIDDSPCYVGELTGTLDCATLDFAAEGFWDGVYDDGPPLNAAMRGNLAEFEGFLLTPNCGTMIKWKITGPRSALAWASCSF